MDAKPALDTILVGKDRTYNRRFQQMCSHFLVGPVACAPALGWEKGQVENQVGVIRWRFFVPRPKLKSFAELNARLLDRCVAWAKVHRHPEIRDKTTWKVFEEEQPRRVPYAALCEGVHSADVILNILARRREPERPADIATPEALKLTREPVADCARYDTLKRAPNGTNRHAGHDEPAEALRNEGSQ